MSPQIVDEPPPYLCSGVAIILLGYIHLLEAEMDNVDEDIGIVMMLMGSAMYQEECREYRLQSRVGGRYGPRGPYNTERTQAFIDNLIANDSARVFKAWFR